MAFIDERILECVAYGFSFEPVFRTTVLELKSGAEVRNAEWSRFRWRGIAPYANIRPESYHLLLGAFLRAHGMKDSFRFKNWMEGAVEGQSLGVAPSGSTAVQLVRDYDPFGGSSYRRMVTKPVDGTVTVYQDGFVKAGTTDPLTGLFTPTSAWTDGLPLTADFEYDIPVRFDTDSLPFSYDNLRALNGEVPIVEVLE